MRVGLLGGWGTGNPGNDATARAVADHLRGEHDVVLVTYADRPAPVEGLEGLPCVPLGEGDAGGGRTRVGRALHRVRAAAAGVRRAWRSGRTAGAMVVTGGGFFEAEATAGVGVLEMLALSVLTFASSTHGRTLVVLAVGGTTTSRRWERTLLALSMRRASYRSFRDLGSRDAMVRMGGALPDDPVSTDVVFASTAGPEPTRDGGAPAVREDPGLLALGVMRFPWLGPGGAAELARTSYVQALADAVERHVAAGGRAALLGGDAADLAVVEAVGAEAARRLGPDATGRSVESWGVPSFAEQVARIARCDAVAASRFHTVVAAVVAGRPVVAVADRAKVRALMADAGLSPWVVGARGLEAARLDKLLGELRDRDAEVRGTVVAARDRLAATARSQLRELDEVLAGARGR